MQHAIEHLRDIADCIEGVLVMHPFGAENCEGAASLASHARRSRNEDEARHLRGLLVEIKNYPNALLAGIDIGIQQLDQPLLCLQSSQHLAKPFTVCLTANKVRHSFDIHRFGQDLTHRQGLRPKLLYCVEHLLVLAAFTLHKTGKLGPHTLNAPAPKVLIQEVCRCLKLSQSKVTVQSQHTITH